MNWIKFGGGIVCLVCAYFAYRDAKSKKMLKPGDNQFFVEDPNAISPTRWVNSWSLVLLIFTLGILLMWMAFE